MDKYVLEYVLLPCDKYVVQAKVVGLKHGRDSNPLCMRHSNPILDTWKYQVEFLDNSNATYSANVIAKNIYSFCRRSPITREMG